MPRLKLIILISLPLVLFVLSLCLGRYPVALTDIGQILAAKAFPFLGIDHTWPPEMEMVIINIRLPRALIALIVGAGLSVSGAAYQGMFQNPLVSPDILGVSSAAGFGAALAILISGNPAIIQVSAFIFGISGVILTYLMSRIYKTTPILMLVLSGVVVAALFSALTSVTKYVADPYSKLPAITFWLMGSLSTASSKDLFVVVPPVVIGSTGLLLVSWRINILAMGDVEARSLGVRTEVLKSIIIICTTVVTASAVCVAGVIGWVGLVIPHLARMMVGPDHKVLLPTAMAIGAAYILFIDDIARTATAAEIPLGILTAIVGAPFFAFLLRRTKGGWK
jgi:iron complex transport system permease protein